jgi:uncharacterized protein with ParB-like and HNH nuclease domain/predicted transport protein
MKATEANLLAFLRKSPQFVIPIYQRTYSWRLGECKQLWDDILRAGRSDDVSAHFIGSVVYIEKGLYQISSQSPLLVIDGQQRLTTVSLILEALARHLGESEAPLDGFSARKLRSYYLLNPLEDGDSAFKLLLTQTDRQTLLALVQQKAARDEASVRISENFEFFQRAMVSLGSDVLALCKGLAKLMIVDVSLSRDQDNPQLIFESMNSTGRELSQADLIRNFVLMGLEPWQQNQLYEEHWRPMETGFGQEAYGSHFDSFMRHYLTLKTGEIPNVRAVYEAFKVHANMAEVAGAGVDELVAEIHKFAGYYCAMALGQEHDKPLAAAFRDLREMKVDVAYPFLLELYNDFAQGLLSSAEFAEAVRLIEAYVFRRAVCAIPTNSLNKTFATFGRALKKDRYLESIKAHLLRMPSYRRFPRNDEFRQDLSTRDLYNFPRRSYWLRRLENHGRKERVTVDEYTIEHILPQNPNMTVHWRHDVGPEWKQVQQTWLHTLGNLTLTGYNSEYSDRPFAEKRDMTGGFRESPLKLNQGLAALEKWDEEAIKLRADRLSSIAIRVWAQPALPQEVLDAYRPASARQAGYSIEDHPFLANGQAMRPVFDVLRKEILALDPCVTEEFLKLYVAYKAETNFVDVVPQAARLRLSLNMPYHELRDPQRLAKDVTNLGRWGNGDVEVGLSDLDAITYVMGLVRQAFERQMAEGGFET